MALQNNNTGWALSAGGTVSVYVGPLNPGRYEFFDDFHPSTRGFIVVK